MRLNVHPRLAAGIGAGAILLMGALLAEPAFAYPQFQLSTGNTRCNLCHFAPAGGGLITDYGRDEAEGSISMTAGNSRLAHGLFTLPDWVVLGGDLRGAAVVKDNGTNPQYLLFPMQADLYARLAKGPVSLNVTVGMRGAARGSSVSLAERVISREHYIMWQPEDIGWYARAGRFFAPYGLRLQDHTAYVRRYLGQHTLEETYNVSAGFIEDAWELHATVFASPRYLSIPDLLGSGVGTPSRGAAVYYERRGLDDTLAYGVQSRVDIGDEDNKYWVGGVGKYWIEGAKLLLLSQLDIGLQTFAFDGPDPQLVLSAHLGATYFLRQGVLLGAALERYDPHVRLSGSARDSVNLSAQWFFRSHWELVLYGKLDVQENVSSADPTGMLMLHYYL